MQGFLLSIRVVTPILLMLCVGMLVRRLGWVDEKTLNVMDRLGFKLLLPTQLFYSLYHAEWNVSVYGKPLLASIVIILIILVLALLIFGRLEPDPKRRGPVIQCEIRVNFVIFGMAIIASLYGSENTGLIAIMAAIIIPLTSTISAILFEVYRGGRVKPAMLLLNIIKNPYLIGAALGLIFLLLRIPLPQPVEKTVIDRAVRIVYRPYIADPRPENMPLLEDLYDEIKRQPEPEAQRIAAALELYVHGSLNVFNHRTNVDINNRIVCFDIKELGKQLKSLGMLVIQDQVWNRVSQNRDQGKSTWYFVDEFHLLLRGEVGSWSVEIWKRFRKWGGIPTGITQNIKDLLSSPEIENIFENSDFVYLLNQASGDRKILCERLNISNQQAAHISNAGPGEGLIFFGNVILPFVDDFPQDNELYSIMTTKPGESIISDSN